MKTTQTPEQIKTLCEVVTAAGGRLFRHESGDPKYNAQRNLMGRTHYVDTDTLRWHKSRVLSTAILADGLLFRITESCALNMHNTSRGKRCAVFDVFGTIVSRPDLENTFSTSTAAENASKREEIDLAAHYREAIASHGRRWSGLPRCSPLPNLCQRKAALPVLPETAQGAGELERT